MKSVHLNVPPVFSSCIGLHDPAAETSNGLGELDVAMEMVFTFPSNGLFVESTVWWFYWLDCCKSIPVATLATVTVITRLDANQAKEREEKKMEQLVVVVSFSILSLFFFFWWKMFSGDSKWIFWLRHLRTFMITQISLSFSLSIPTFPLIWTKGDLFHCQNRLHLYPPPLPFVHQKK